MPLLAGDVDLWERMLTLNVLTPMRSTSQPYLPFVPLLKQERYVISFRSSNTLKKTHPEGRMLYCAGLQESLHLT